MRTASKNIAIVLGLSVHLLCLSCSHNKPKPHLFQSETNRQIQSELESLYALLNSKKDSKSQTENFDPVGKDFNTIIDCFEQNGLAYMRFVSDLNNNCLLFWVSGNLADSACLLTRKRIEN